MIADLLKRIFGDKSAKDRKEYQPLIDQTNEQYESIKKLSDNELRDQTPILQDIIKKRLASLENELKELKTKVADNTLDIQEKEDIYLEIDSYTKKIEKEVETYS